MLLNKLQIVTGKGNINLSIQVGCQEAERLGNRATNRAGNLKVASSIPGRVK